MKFLQSRFGNSLFGSQSRPPGSQSDWKRSGDSRVDSRLQAEADEVEAHAIADAQAKLQLRKELLEVVLAKTIQKTQVPAAWIGGELNPMVLPSGEAWIEVRLSLQVDEPRFYTYMGAFQAEFERRMLAAAPDAREWLAGIAWKITTDAIFEPAMPQADYWEQVQADRLLTARQKGAAEWDRESLERHFSDTNPGELVVDFEDTHPPERGAEDIAPPPKR